MNTNEPYDVRRLDEIPPEKRGGYIPVPERVKGMTPEERATFLSNLRARMVNVQRSAAIGQQVFDRLQAAVNPLIDKMDENGADEEQAQLVIGMLVGCRAWVGSFKGLEDSIIDSLSECGISRDAYTSMCLQADAGGIQAIELVKKLIAEEDAEAAS